MDKNEQVSYEIASAINRGESDEYIAGLLKMASVALGRTESTICGWVGEMLDR